MSKELAKPLTIEQILKKDDEFFKSSDEYKLFIIDEPLGTIQELLHKWRDIQVNLLTVFDNDEEAGFAVKKIENMIKKMIADFILKHNSDMEYIMQIMNDMDLDEMINFYDEIKERLHKEYFERFNGKNSLKRIYYNAESIMERTIYLQVLHQYQLSGKTLEEFVNEHWVKENSEWRRPDDEITKLWEMYLKWSEYVKENNTDEGEGKTLKDQIYFKLLFDRGGKSFSTSMNTAILRMLKSQEINLEALEKLPEELTLEIKDYIFFNYRRKMDFRT